MSLFTSGLPVPDALAGSMIWEELRGDFALARAAVEEQVAKAQQGDPLQLSQAWLASGVVQLLRGEAAAALDDIAQAARLTTDDSPFRLLVFAYQALALHWCFHVFPGGAGGITLEIQDRWDLTEVLEAEDRRWTELVSELAPASDRVPFSEAGLVFHLLRMLPLYRQLLDGRYVTPPERLVRQREMILGNLLLFRRGAEQKGAPSALLAWIDRSLADIHWRLAEKAEAGAYLDRAFDLSAEADDPVGMALCYMEFGDWQAAPVSSPWVWNLLLQEGIADSSLSPVRERAELDGGGVDVSAASMAYIEAEKLFQRADARRGLGAIELRRGYLRRLERDFGAAVDHAGRAEAFFAGAGDGFGVQLARAHRILARIGRPEGGGEDGTAAAIGHWGRQEGSFAFAAGLGLLCGRMGRYWLLRDGDFERALACFSQARHLFEALDASGDAIRTLADEGETYLLAGEHDACLVAYERAWDGFLARMSARPRFATSAWQQALQTADQVLLLQLRRRDANGLERSVLRFQELIRREPPLDRSDFHGPAFQDIPQRRIAARLANLPVFINLCRARETLDDGRPQEAQPFIDAALAAARAEGVDGGEFLQAEVLVLARRYQEATALFLQYLDYAGAAKGGTSWMFQDELVDRVSRVGPAGRTVAEDHPLGVHEIAAEFFVRVRDYPRAKLHVEALEVAEGPNWWRRRQRPWEALAYAGELQEGLKRPDLALDLYETAIGLLDERWSLLRRDDLKVAIADAVGGASLYLRAARACLRAGAAADLNGAKPAARAFSYAEQGKARALLDLMAASASASADPQGRTIRQLHARLSVKRGLLAREREAPQSDPLRIVQLEQQLQDTETELRQIEAEWIDRSGAFPQARILDVDQVRKYLAKDSALLLYFFHRDDLLIWAVSTDTEVRACHSEVDTRVLSRMIRNYQKACYESRDWEYEPLGKELAKLLLEPIAEVLDVYPRLILVPHGPAHLLPFAVLPWRGEPLSATHILSYLPSASSLQFLRTEPATIPPVSILAVGNPARMSYQPPEGGPLLALPPLQGAAAEAAFVASLYPEGDVLLEEQASRKAVREKIAGRQVLHFATHGSLSERAPLLSSVQLANGESLSVLDLVGERLDAKLVVLSACETAHGRRTGGDDVLGLTRGLLSAGAGAAMVSLWKVRDASTALLMSFFHRRLRLGDPPAVALQKAQNWLRTLPEKDVPIELENLQSRLGIMEEPVARSIFALRTCGNSEPHSFWRGSRPIFRLPYFWAPFILVGRE